MHPLVVKAGIPALLVGSGAGTAVITYTSTLPPSFPSKTFSFGEQHPKLYCRLKENLHPTLKVSAVDKKITCEYKNQAETVQTLRDESAQQGTVFGTFNCLRKGETDDYYCSAGNNTVVLTRHWDKEADNYYLYVTFSPAS